MDEKQSNLSRTGILISHRIRYILSPNLKIIRQTSPVYYKDNDNVHKLTAGNLGIAVLMQVSVEYGITDLITDLVYNRQ